jgi:2-polyprenyl-3-methyl-5-hydroxy-6-metoxy-1,4-benzoquinol methylase
MTWKKHWDSDKNINNNILQKWSEYYCLNIKKLNQLDMQDNVLDIGAGDGEISIFIAGEVNRVVAYDTSDAMYELCNEKAAESTNVICTTSLKNHSDISFVIINSVLQYLDDKEWSNILNFITNETKASKVIISDIVPDNHSIALEAITNLIYSIKHSFFLNYLIFLTKEFIKRIVLDRSLSLNKYNKDILISMLIKKGWNVKEIDNLSPSINRFSLFCNRNL